MLVRDVVRLQARLKGMYRARGIATPGSGVYGPKERDRWLARLPVSSRGATAKLHNGAATTIVTRLDTDPLYEHDLRLTSAGTQPNLAKLTVARCVAAIVLRMWKDEKQYDPDQPKLRASLASAVS